MAINDLPITKARTEALVTRIETVPVSGRPFESRGTLSAQRVPLVTPGETIRDYRNTSLETELQVG